MLELMANLVAAAADGGGTLSSSSALLPAPVLFLFSGAEEPLCQSASAWMRQSKWARRAGAFINLEALGPGGVPVVFQHAGAWTARAYARGAAHPRGASSAQDVFDAGLVIGETDFSRLSYRHAGRLPGLDVAYLADGAAYHTGLDTMARLRPGVLQEVGETVGGVVREFAAELAAGRGGVTGGDSSSDISSGDGSSGGEPQQAAAFGRGLREEDKALFFSLGGRVMVVYGLRAARLLHTLPLVVGAALPWAFAAAAPGCALPPGRGLAIAAGGAARALAGLLAAPLLAAALGAARAWASGKPLVWFAHPWATAAIYFPAAFGAQLLCYAGCCDDADVGGGGAAAAAASGGVRTRSKKAGASASLSPPPPPLLPLLAYRVLGGALMNGAIAAAATQFGIGMSCLFAMWGGAGVLAALLTFALGGSSSGGGTVTPRAAAAVLAATALPAYACFEMAMGVCLALLGRMSLTGHVFVGLGDAIAGVLVAVGAVAVLGGVVTPVLVAALGERGCRRAAAALLMASVGGAAVASVALTPYSAAMPKRLLIMHLHRTEPVPSGGEPAGSDAVAQDQPQHVASRVVSAHWSFAGADSTPVDALMRAMRLPVADARAHPPAGDEWASIYPISELLDVRLLPTRPVAAPPVKVLPYIRLVSEETNVLTAADGGGTYREVAFDVYSEAPCWGVLNVTAAGGILSWSLTPERFSARAAPTARIVRWTSQRWRTPWRVTVRVGSGGEGGASAAALRVKLHIDYLAPTREMRHVIGRVPPWGTMTFASTGYVSEWVL